MLFDDFHAAKGLGFYIAPTLALFAIIPFYHLAPFRDGHA